MVRIGEILLLNFKSVEAYAGSRYGHGHPFIQPPAIQVAFRNW